MPQNDDKAQLAANVALVNEFKQDEERLLRKLDEIRKKALSEASSLSSLPYDPRWVAIARNHFEQGFMALNRAVFQPGRIVLPEDEESKDV